MTSELKTTIRKEGRAARNLTNWSVPNNEYTDEPRFSSSSSKSRSKNFSNEDDFQLIEDKNTVKKRKNVNTTKNNTSSLINKNNKKSIGASKSISLNSPKPNSNTTKISLNNSSTVLSRRKNVSADQQKPTPKNSQNNLRQASDTCLNEKIAIQNDSYTSITMADSHNSINSINTLNPSHSSSCKNLRYRNWKNLFQKTKEALDDIYHFCEQDKSIDECTETVLVLESYVKDFKSLGKLIALDLDNPKNQTSPNRPVSWDIRKTTPVRASQYGSLNETQVKLKRNSQQLARRNNSNGPIPISEVVRLENKNSKQPTTILHQSSANSWADRVRKSSMDLLQSDLDPTEQVDEKLEEDFLNHPTINEETINEVIQESQSKMTLLTETCTEECLLKEADLSYSNHDINQISHSLSNTNQSTAAFDWATMMNEHDDEMEILRQPGGAAKIHEKLSSPSRKKREEADEIQKRLEERHKKAEVKRLEIESSRKQNAKAIEIRIIDIKEQEEIKKQERLNELNKKLEKASSSRNEYYEKIQEKAKDEQNKVSLLTFINNLENNIKREDAQRKIKLDEFRTEAIIHQREQLKEKLVQENLEREQAAVERRKLLDEEKRQKATLLSEKRRKQEERIHKEREISKNLSKQLAKEREEIRLQKLRDIEIENDLKIKKLKENIEIKKDRYKKNQTEILNAKKEKAAEFSSGQLYNSLDGGSICRINEGYSPISKNKNCRSLPSSPRVNESHSNENLSRIVTPSHVKNLFQKQATERSAIEKTRNLSCPGTISPEKGDCLTPISGHNHSENGDSDVQVQQAENANENVQQNNKISEEIENINDDPASQYFMTEKSIENLEKIAKFEKMMKKRLKKIKTRMTARSSKLEELEKNSSESRKSSRPSSNRNKISKNLKDIEKAISLHDVNISFWPDQRVKVVDRACRDLIKLMSIGSDKMRDLEIEMQTFRQFKGHQTLVKLLFLGVFGRFLV